MNLSDFEKFLERGSLLRWRDEYHLSVGVGEGGFKILFQDFFDSQATEIRGDQSFRLTSTEFKALLKRFENRTGLGLVFEDPKFSDYEIAFNKIQAQIKSGSLKKAVPVLFAEAHREFDKVSALKSLTEAPPNLYLYGQWNEREGILGATPETLATYVDGELKSMALAGTQIKDGSSCRLLEDQKELHEHQLTVQDIKSVLAEFGDVSVSALEVLELPTLWHLQSKIRVKPRVKIDIAKIVKALHPTPALGVAPRDFGYKWLKTFPQADIRGKFGAPLTFEFENGDFISLVAIRNVQWIGEHVILGAGGGVVGSSQIDNEWRELQGKRDSVKKLMGLPTS